MTTIAIYGGSFDPPHNGHDAIVRWLLSSGTADFVWLVPSFKHAFGKDSTSWETRMAWCLAWAEGLDPRVGVSSLEGLIAAHNPDAPVYTIDVLDTLACADGDSAFRLVVGADNWARRGEWKDWQRIEQMYTPIVLGRGGIESPQGFPNFGDQSSSEVRRRLTAGEDVKSLLPVQVYDLVCGYYHGKKHKKALGSQE